MAILSGQTTPFTSFLPQPNKLILMLVFTLALNRPGIYRHHLFLYLAFVRLSVRPM